MTSEVRCWCRHCKAELPPNHTGPCPHCGKLGKDCKATATTVVGVKESVSGTHKPEWSGKSLTILFGITGILLSVVILGILTLLPFYPIVNYGILLLLLLAVVGVLWWKRYSVLMLIRVLEGKLGGEKKLK